MIKEKGKNELWAKYDPPMYIYCLVKYKSVRLVTNIQLMYGLQNK